MAITLGAFVAPLVVVAPANSECGGPGSCIEVHPTGGCSDVECCKQVCAIFQDCCDSSWDALCVELAVTKCGYFIYECPVVPFAPANDCATSATEVAFETTYVFNTTNATTDGPPQEQCDTTNDIWFYGRPPQDGELRIEVSSSFDSTIAIYAIGADPAFDPQDLPELLVGCTNAEGPGFELAVLSDAVANEYYLVQIGGFQGDSGPGDVFFTFRPALSFHAFGLLNTALGAASMTLDTEAVVLSGIGPSGQDGVRIDLGQSEGWSADFENMPDLAVKGRVLTTAMRGRVDQMDDQIIALARIEGIGEEALAQVDFAGIGSPLSLVSLYDPEGELLAEFPIDNNATIALSGGNTIDALVTSVEVVAIDSICAPDIVVIQTDPPVGASPPNGDPRITNVGTITFTALDFDTAPAFVSAGTVQGTNLGSFSISNEAVRKLSQLHTGLGEAQLEPLGGVLAITNIGSSGQDGVTVALDDTLNFRAKWQPLELLDEGFLEFRTVGTLGGMADQPLGFAKVTRNGGLYEYTADYSELGSPTQLLRIYEDDVLIASFPNQTGILATTQAPPGGCGKGPDTPDCPADPPCIWVLFDEDVKIDVAGFDPVVGNKLLILSESGVPVDALQSFTILAADVFGQGLSITEETAAPQGDGGCPADLTGDCVVDSADLGLLLGSWGIGGSADLDGDGSVSSADLGLMLGVWGPCLQ